MSDAPNSKFERDTWPELSRLAKDVPAAGIHFQSTQLSEPLSRPFRCQANTS